jgi:hypothetical protein
MKEARLREQAKLARNKEQERVLGKVQKEEDHELEVMRKEIAIAWESAQQRARPEEAARHSSAKEEAIEAVHCDREEDAGDFG